MPKAKNSKFNASKSMKEKVKQFKPIKETIEQSEEENEMTQEKKKSAPSKENQSTQPLTKRLFIGGLEKSITEQQIKERFIKYGKVLSIELINKEWKDTLFGYVEFRAKNDLLMHQCLSTLNMLTWKGHKLRVEYANSDMLDTYKEERKMYFIERKRKMKEQKEIRVRKNRLAKKMEEQLKKEFYIH